MTDFNKPDLSSREVEAIDEYKARDVSVAQMFDSGADTNIPEGVIRFNIASGVFQRREGSQWVTKELSNDSLGDVLANSGNFGTNISIPSITVNSKGRITAVSLNTIRTGTTSQTGVVQLNNTVTSTSSAQAATANAVKTANDNANNRALASRVLSGTNGISVSGNGDLTTNRQITVRDGTTSQTGIVQLNNTTTSTSTTQAATANSVNLAKDAADSAQSSADSAQSSANAASNKATPKTLTGATTNSSDGSGHSHGIDFSTSDLDVYGLTVGRGSGSVSSNTVIGLDALRDNTSGEQNTAHGTVALIINTTGSDNTAIGHSALNNNLDGNMNTAIGLGALLSSVHGDNNIGVGRLAGTVASPFSVTTQDNRIVIGNNDHTHAYIKIGFTVTSDVRDKSEIIPIPLGLDFVNELKPTEYQFKAGGRDGDPDGHRRYGFLAQDVLAAEGDNPVIVDTEDSDNLKLHESYLIPVLVNAIKELTARIEELEKQL